MCHPFGYVRDCLVDRSSTPRDQTHQLTYFRSRPAAQAGRGAVDARAGIRPLPADPGQAVRDEAPTPQQRLRHALLPNRPTGRFVEFHRWSDIAKIGGQHVWAPPRSEPGFRPKAHLIDLDQGRVLPCHPQEDGSRFGSISRLCDGSHGGLSPRSGAAGVGVTAADRTPLVTLSPGVGRPIRDPRPAGRPCPLRLRRLAAPPRTAGRRRQPPRPSRRRSRRR